MDGDARVRQSSGQLAGEQVVGKLAVSIGTVRTVADMAVQIVKVDLAVLVQAGRYNDYTTGY